jgi:uncharacterized protein
MDAVWEDRFAAYLGTGGDAAHDRAHVRRVVANARLLTAAEGANLDVVLPAAWLHDCVSFPKNSPDRPRASRAAAAAASDFLNAAGYDAALIPAIAHAIEAHSFTAGIPPRTIEAKVVQDADRLDALGAIGIARTFVVGGALGRAIYDAAEPIPRSRVPDDGHNSVDHFFTKLFTLAGTMQTAAGRREAERRTATMTAFLGELEREIAGDGLA